MGFASFSDVSVPIIANFFIHSSVDRHLGCFQFLAIVSRGACIISNYGILWIYAQEWDCRIMKESESEVTQSCLTLCDPLDYSLPTSSVQGILQARILEWVAISFSMQNHSSAQ